MPRKKQYDEVEVLEKAMLTFWEQGYYAVNTRELARAMGINQFSVYASFDNKETLFVKALEHYSEVIIHQRMLPPIAGENSTLDNLRQFLEQFIDTEDMGFPRGCFVCNTMIEASGVNSQIDNVIQNYRNTMLERFKTILGNSYPDADEQFIQVKSEFLFGAFMGLIMLHKIGISGNPIQNYVNEIMKAIS